MVEGREERSLFLDRSIFEKNEHEGFSFLQAFGLSGLV